MSHTSEHMVRCPECNSSQLDVVYTKIVRKLFRSRRRYCRACKHRFYTAQLREFVLPADEKAHTEFYHFAIRCESLLTPKLSFSGVLPDASTKPNGPPTSGPTK